VEASDEVVWCHEFDQQNVVLVLTVCTGQVGGEIREKVLLARELKKNAMAIVSEGKQAERGAASLPWHNIPTLPTKTI